MLAIEQLYIDQYCMLILLCMFNRSVTSLRGLQQASGLKRVWKKLGYSRASPGYLSESVAVFDSERLMPIIKSPGDKLVPIAADKRLKDIQQTLTLVDGSSYVSRIRDNSDFYRQFPRRLWN